MFAEKYMVFCSSDGSLKKRWRWSKLDNPTASKAPKSLLRVKHDKYGDFYLGFEDRQELRVVKEKVSWRITVARASKDAAIAEAIELLTAMKEEKRNRESLKDFISSRPRLSTLSEDMTETSMFTETSATSSSVSTMELEMAVLRGQVNATDAYETSVGKQEHSPTPVSRPSTSSTTSRHWKAMSRSRAPRWSRK